ncbi:hypothetical protein DPMN_150038 [Dreissena polymorpha]|uniref:Uncharacterized protein n=1 Tax=Dreissena polymorpha TaxID=45954 RepID=A0A9D4FH66_DREPO|nr:hypothetical protein DPMN_150038 [Dreissena polymorpha]
MSIDSANPCVHELVITSIFLSGSRTDNSRESMVKALTGLLSPAQLESGKKSVEARKAFLQKELLNILENDEDSPDTNENLEDQKK